MSDISEKRSGFGIGELGQTPATDTLSELEAERLQPTATAQTRFGTCQRCGARVPRSWLMSASRGIVCPDCYDEWSN